MKKIRINELARELEVKPGVILDMLPDLGVQEKKTHSSSVDEDVAIALRDRLVASGELRNGSAKADYQDEGHDDERERERQFFGIYAGRTGSSGTSRERARASGSSACSTSSAPAGTCRCGSQSRSAVDPDSCRTAACCSYSCSCAKSWAGAAEHSIALGADSSASGSASSSILPGGCSGSGQPQRLVSRNVQLRNFSHCVRRSGWLVRVSRCRLAHRRRPPRRSALSRLQLRKQSLRLSRHRR